MQHFPLRSRCGFARLVLAAGGAAITALLAGCGATPTGPVASAGHEIRGVAMGGNQVLGNSVIGLYAVGGTGYASASTPLLTSPVMSDVNGNFNITGLWSCPDPSTQIYLTVQGGNPGLVAGTNNTTIAEIVLLGRCDTLASRSFATVNEQTTVAAVWALAPFMSSISNIGAPSSNYTGLLQAVTTAMELADPSTGRTPGIGIPAIATIPSTEISTLADILAACVNSSGSQAAGTPCNTLMTATTPVGGTRPTDIVQAALNITRYPGTKVSALYGLLPANPPFQPALPVQPVDFTVNINYTSTAFAVPMDIFVDDQDTVWVLGTSTTNNVSASSLTLLTQNGILATYPQSPLVYNNMAIDTTDAAWLSNSTNSNLMVITTTGSRGSSNPYTGGGLNAPGPIAFDAAGNAWIVNGNKTVTKMTGNGVPISTNTGYGTGALSGPTAIAMDGANNAFIANSGNNTVSRLASNGTAYTGSPFAGGGLNGPFAIGLDAAGNIWALNRTGSSLTKFSSNGTASPFSPFYGGGMNTPVAMALDGDSQIWVVNSGANTLSKFDNSGNAISTTAGLGSVALKNPYKLAIDRAGNVWVMNLGTATVGSYTITQVVGAAAPVVTPMATAVANGAIGARP